jgi:hypothetical protein
MIVNAIVKAGGAAEVVSALALKVAKAVQAED